jgi:hypothetical protein
MKIRRTIVTGIFLAGLFACCSPSLYLPTPEYVTTEATLEQLNAGREVYVRNCSSCHNLHTPKQFSANRWAEILPTMQQKAKISNEERELIRKYIHAGLR